MGLLPPQVNDNFQAIQQSNFPHATNSQKLATESSQEVHIHFDLDELGSEQKDKWQAFYDWVTAKSSVIQILA
ncbi:MAG: hypothetical protein WA110_02460 [Anaerolineaceae bacterium]